MIEAVLSMFREPSLCRHVHRECTRSALLDVTPLIAATACHQRNDVERYRRCMQTPLFVRPLTADERATLETEQHLDNLRRKYSLRGAETPEISVRPGNYSASYFEGSATGLRSSSAFTVRRCQMLLASAEGQSTPTIAHTLRCTDQTVRNAIHAFHRRGLAVLQPLSSRPHTLA